ncbi:MAG: phosphoribosylformylglycinamidine synthase I [candidate division KSB1 bacterium]|nr:phosphoribosylformylglycinamidine synthase I [candidate division KSB1 bacterium]MDZ7334042.1 phosphoribosylformylglycinamidine synthase I [candidate division KSB1 bacterium]MDZ7356886.1 phosphoribosylformylglycinamidine synthase I [candidate division KSB1 bacterium]MDZ7377409.1 phosphoribosylformylglycinamidine synthase I [candidate division KSB1 bacterium]MDZ7399530.1 phosphoribosylformylglycinamidine synthase I [candidate division KSB1 bacterium]
MKVVKTIVIRTAGSNCDYETVHAFEQVGSQVSLVHINQLISGKIRLSDFDILAIPGGFTYGDDISAGKILANEIKYKLTDQVAAFIAEGKLIIGICNGFQVLVKAGLLPAVDLLGTTQLATLTFNDSGKFEDRWVYLKLVSQKCVFTRSLASIVYYPVAHAEGKFIVKDATVLDQLKNNDQIVFQYVDATGQLAGYPWNPNGSIENIAGICDPSGRIFGLMPHPERHFHPTHHPRWTREGLRPEPDGVMIFRNAVNYIQENL